MNLRRLISVIGLGWCCGMASHLPAAIPEEASSIVLHEYRSHLLRDPDPQELTSWTTQLQREGHDARFMVQLHRLRRQLGRENASRKDPS